MKEIWSNIHLASLIGVVIDGYFGGGKYWWVFLICIFISTFGVKFEEDKKK